MKVWGIVVISVLISSVAWAHCQVPCGIFNDNARLEAINEHIRTIEKAMINIDKLGDANSNQTIRWVHTKDTHAQYIHDVLHDYFLAQRVKPLNKTASKTEQETYHHTLTIIHELTVAAMKSKQGVDQKWIKKMNTLSQQLHQSFH